jgi:hypothetical protein
MPLASAGAEFVTQLSIFDTYRHARRRAFERLNDLRLRVDEWLEAHEQSAELADLARLEALHAERERVVAELQEAEDRLIRDLIKNRQAARQAPVDRKSS